MSVKHLKSNDSQQYITIQNLIELFWSSCNLDDLKPLRMKLGSTSKS